MLQSIHYGDPDGVLGKTACLIPLYSLRRQDLNSNWLSVTCKKCLEKRTVTPQPLYVKQMTCPKCWGTKHFSPMQAGQLTSIPTYETCSNCKGQGVVPDKILSKNFQLSELIASNIAVRKMISNVPEQHHIDNLKLLAAEILQPLRDEFGPLHTDSGLRLNALNVAVGGVTGSAHEEGNAADVVPITHGVTLKKMMDWLKASKLPVDQAIFEGTWLHVGRKKDALLKPRGQFLMMFGGKYFPYDPKDPRVNL